MHTSRVLNRSQCIRLLIHMQEVYIHNERDFKMAAIIEIKVSHLDSIYVTTGDVCIVYNDIAIVY